MTVSLGDVLYGILAFGAMGIAGFTVKYLKEISKNLQDLNVKVAVIIERHENLEKRVEKLEDKTEDL